MKKSLSANNSSPTLLLRLSSTRIVNEKIVSSLTSDSDPEIDPVFGLRIKLGGRAPLTILYVN